MQLVEKNSRELQESDGRNPYPYLNPSHPLFVLLFFQFILAVVLDQVLLHVLVLFLHEDVFGNHLARLARDHLQKY